MKTDNVYEEKIFSKWITLMMFMIEISFLSAFFYRVFVGPIGVVPIPSWFFLVMFLLFSSIRFNFNILSIKMTSQSITVGYGIFKNTILWENIEDCYLDETSAIRYGGWSIRTGRVIQSVYLGKKLKIKQLWKIK